MNAMGLRGVIFLPAIVCLLCLGFQFCTLAGEEAPKANSPSEQVAGPNIIDVNLAVFVAADYLPAFYPGNWEFFNHLVCYDIDGLLAAYVIIFRDPNSTINTWEEVTAQVKKASDELDELDRQIRIVKDSQQTHQEDKDRLIKERKAQKTQKLRKSRRVGRPNINWELIKLIRRMQKDNLTWSAQRIQGELEKLGYSVCDNTVAKYMRKPKTEPEKCQRWLTFMRNHTKYTVGIDFLVARTIFFKSIHVFVAISHDRRKILHFAVSSNPHSQWAIQQFRETFAFDETTKYVIRDNDKIFSEDFKQHIKRFGLKDKPTAFHSPWQNPFCERVIGTLRRECLDHLIIFNEKHLYNVLYEYIFEYYNVSRTHMSLEKDSPEHRDIQKDGKVVSKPILSGLHHVYSRVA